MSNFDESAVNRVPAGTAGSTGGQFSADPHPSDDTVNLSDTQEEEVYPTPPTNKTSEHHLDPDDLGPRFNDGANRLQTAIYGITGIGAVAAISAIAFPTMTYVAAGIMAIPIAIGIGMLGYIIGRPIHDAIQDRRDERKQNRQTEQQQ